MAREGRGGSETQLVKLVQRYEDAAARAFTMLYGREGNLREWVRHVIDAGLVTQKDDETWHAALILRNGIVSGNPYFTDVKLKYLRGAIGRMRPLVNKLERGVEALAQSISSTPLPGEGDNVLQLPRPNLEGQP
jgi:hypothetical protein